MQETRYEGETLQRIYRGVDANDLQRQMDEALRPGEELVRRVPLDHPTIHAMNRHERRKAAALNRRK